MNVRDITTAPSKQAQATCKKHRRSRGAAVYAQGPLQPGDRLLSMREVEGVNYDPKGTMNEPASRKVYASSAPLPEASPEFVAHQAAQTMAAAQYDAINATARMNQQVAAYAQAVKATAK